MAKVTAPLLSFGGSGQVGQSIVFGSWKGRQYARRYTTPSNPQTTDQMLTRHVFSWLQQAFKLAPPLLVEPWTEYAKGKVMSDRNAWNKFNIPVLREDTDVAEIIFSPGARGGLSPTAAVPTGGAGQISTAVTAPAVLPSGWAAYSCVVAVVRAQDPHSGTLYQIYAGEDLSSPYTIVITGLPAGTYEVRAWAKQTRPDGLIAFSPSFDGGTAVVT